MNIVDVCINEDETIQLLPCPNCGQNNQDKIQLHYWSQWFKNECFEYYNVKCNLCLFASTTKNTEEEAINDWQLTSFKKRGK